MLIFLQKHSFAIFLFCLTASFSFADTVAAQTFTVTKTADTNDNVCNSDCSLREAIAAANASAELSLINFDPQIFSTSQTITLTNGELFVSDTRRVIIAGTGANLLTVSGNNQSRVFRVGRDANVTLNNLTISGGNGAGNESSGEGGAIYVAPNGSSTQLTISNSVLRNNQALLGGAIRTFGQSTVNISGTMITNNTITGSNGNGSGGGIYMSGGLLNLTDSTVADNAAENEGGGIFNLSRATVSNSVIRNNTARSGGGIFTHGNLSLSNSTLANNVALNYGGGIYNNLGGASSIAATINNSLITGNRANGFGGGILNRDRMDVVNSTVSNNNAGDGGGVINGFLDERLAVLSVNGSTISGNQAYTRGGGLANEGGTSSLTNVTISGNTVVNGVGGGINVRSSGTVNMANSTVAFNSANTVGGGVYNNSGRLNAQNTIFARNTRGGSTPNDFEGTITSQGYNLIGTVTTSTTITGNTTGNLLNVDPQLLPLANYGGATQTHALRLTSPAIDAGGAAQNVSIDQRGLPRPIDLPQFPNAPSGNGSDIGAFERQTNDAFRRNSQFDFDGDGRADISVFRPNGGFWYVLRSQAAFLGAQWGASGDILAPADYDADGRTDFAVFRRGDGIWYILNSSNNQFVAYRFGSQNDVPRPGDFDGDGRADISVYRATTGQWFRINSSNNQFVEVQFGSNGDVPLIADFDGDGKSDISVYRPSNGGWYWLRSSSGDRASLPFGTSGDIPTPADYDDDGRTDIAVFRPSAGTWYWLNSSNNTFSAVQFGVSGDLPVPADYDGDGRADISVFRPSSGIWYRLNSATNQFSAVQFGANGDIPVPSAFIQ